MPTPPLLPSATVTPSPVPSPSATPLPEERLGLGQAALADGDFSGAAEQFTAGLTSGLLTDPEQIDAQFHLGVAYYEDGRFSEAATVLNELLQQAGTAAPDAALVYLARSLAQLGDNAGALARYDTYLTQNPEMAPYIAPRMADLQLGSGNREAALALLETAVSRPAHRLTEVDNRQRLIQLYTEENNLAAVVAQYDAIRAVAQTDFTRAQMLYLAGVADLQLGNTEAAYGRFSEAIVQYPRIYESYLSLVQLVEAGIPVNEYQRGLVNYHAASYDACVAAFDRYLLAEAEAPIPAAHLFQAWCYEGLGNLTEALAALNRYAELAPANALYETGKLFQRQSLLADAETTYLAFLESYPADENAPDAAWQTAVFAANQNNSQLAAQRFANLANQYPQAERAAEALFRSGLIWQQAGAPETAVLQWQRAAESYPEREFGAASMVWLLRTLPTLAAADTLTNTTTITQVVSLANSSGAVEFYTLRAREIAANELPFDEPSPFAMPTADETAVAQAAAEGWLRGWTGVGAETAVEPLGPALIADTRLVVGEKLWQIGELELAKRELESVRVAFSNDPIASYQLALFFRELGLYRSSILAADTVLRASGENIFEAPRFIGQLIYPVYYADLILPLAEQYGYDPRLQFALVRQESLFESFARSGAAAQGLSQVIPDTGVYIAQQLSWPNFKNEDLYKPYVGLTFGAFYLDQQLGFFDGDVHAALSAYNAGPGNAARWHGVAGDDLDLYVQTVDFWETREYIKRIFVGYELYRFLYE